MPRGGRRIGAGRKRGSKAATKTREIANEAIVRGVKLPLEYMLSIVGDETATQARRDQMAIASAPFCHPRLAVVSTPNAPRGDVTRDGGDAVNIMQIFAVPRGSRVDIKDGTVIAIDGTASSKAARTIRRDATSIDRPTRL